MGVLLTPITNIIELSLKLGVFPDTLKLSHITPLLKKPSLSKDHMKNYRPVSNLNFISKLLEKIIAKPNHSHLESNDLLNRYQSAYRPRHSTETALLKVQNDSLGNLDDTKQQFWFCSTSRQLLTYWTTVESSACWRIGMAKLWVAECQHDIVMNVGLLCHKGGMLPIRTWS